MPGGAAPLAQLIGRLAVAGGVRVLDELSADATRASAPGLIVDVSSAMATPLRQGPVPARLRRCPATDSVVPAAGHVDRSDRRAAPLRTALMAGMTPYHLRALLTNLPR
jgi:hypothetical protein